MVNNKKNVFNDWNLIMAITDMELNILLDFAKGLAELVRRYHSSKINSGVSNMGIDWATSIFGALLATWTP